MTFHQGRISNSDVTGIIFFDSEEKSYLVYKLLDDFYINTRIFYKFDTFYKYIVFYIPVHLFTNHCMDPDGCSKTKQIFPLESEARGPIIKTSTVKTLHQIKKFMKRTFYQYVYRSNVSPFLSPFSISFSLSNYLILILILFSFR